MKREEINAQVLQEILGDLGIDITPEQAKEVSDGFIHHLQMEREMDSYQFSGHKQECDKCKRLESELKDVKRREAIYENSVKERTGAEFVYIEGDRVKYDLR